jgi:hypothetical protein
VKLKDKADMFAARRRAFRITAIRHLPVVDPDVAAILPVEQAKQIQQSAFPTTRRTDNRVYLAALGLERNPLQYMHPSLALPQVAVETGATECDLVVSGGHGELGYCAVPRMTSPGSSRAARRAGTRLASMTMRTAVSTAAM